MHKCSEKAQIDAERKCCLTFEVFRMDRRRGEEEKKKRGKRKEERAGRVGQ